MIARWSALFIPTLREAPAGLLTEGDKLLARAGYMRGRACLHLGRRSLRRIVAMIRGELDALGAQEILAPPGQPIEPLARELRSYRQLPQIWYQFDSRLEARWFASSPPEPETMLRVFRAILGRCGIECLTAEALDGLRLVIPSESGEDSIARAGSYVADLASAKGLAIEPAVPDPEGDFAPEPFHTPNRKTIAELADFTGLPATSHMKSLVIAADGALVMALARGDHQLSEAKLAHALNANALRPATPQEIRQRFGARAGSLGPMGVTGIRILADEALRGRRNMIAGANRDDYHLRHVTPGEDFPVEFFHLRQPAAGEICVRTGEPLRIQKAVTMASLSNRMPVADLHVTDEGGREIPLCVGSYHLALDRILWAAAEQNHDADGLLMPPDLAPFDLIVTPVDVSVEAQRQAAAEIGESAQRAGLDVLLDDREERPGVKFKDADLTGIPWRITIGKKLGQGIVEVFERRTKQKSDVALDAAVAFLSTRR